MEHKKTRNMRVFLCLRFSGCLSESQIVVYALVYESEFHTQNGPRKCLRALEAQRDAKQGKVTAGTRKVMQAAADAVGAGQAAEQLAKAKAEQASLRAVSVRWLAEKRPS
ncbi:hypothetical protein [Dyella japonica]|uniref:hypothetical protein n=1 Tax=Dyella japonica TaxID=231455 RepID=UPI0012FDD9FA|nr:hypothetical protein [Dyella japonica]